MVSVETSLSDRTSNVWGPRVMMTLFTAIGFSLIGLWAVQAVLLLVSYRLSLREGDTSGL